MLVFKRLLTVGLPEYSWSDWSVVRRTGKPRT